MEKERDKETKGAGFMQTCVWSAYLLDRAPERHSLSCLPINLHLCLPVGEGLFSAYMSMY